MPAKPITEVDLLDGIDANTTKAVLLERLNQAADLQRAQTRQRTGRLAEIEQRVRAKYKPGDMPELHQVIISASSEEWQHVVEFLGEWDEPGASLLPTVLARILLGGKELIEQK